jgi:SAM-dependent methyltransferase
MAAAIERFCGVRHMNYFESPSAAERYAEGRPFFQPLVVEHVKRVCCSDGRVTMALDVGCGTGQSTVPLVELAERVVGADSSLAMLRHAHKKPYIYYVAARSEALPFTSEVFDMLVVGLAFHWFDREKFLREANRVLRPSGWLILFDDHFSGQMTGSEEYARWNKEHYAKRFPPPPRNRAPLGQDEASIHGFALRARDQFTHSVAFTPEQLVAYLLTQSNVIALVEGGGGDIEAVREWLHASIRPLFKLEAAEFPFTCVLDIFQRQLETENPARYPLPREGTYGGASEQLPQTP